MSTSASSVFKKHVQGINVMTPFPVAYGFLGRWVYEISEGSGFKNEPMFGVTFVDRNTGELNRELGQLHDSKAAALAWVKAKREEQ
jgi:hypothetical protein